MGLFTHEKGPSSTFGPIRRTDRGLGDSNRQRSGGLEARARHGTKRGGKGL
jgi:hypothetical protein